MILADAVASGADPDAISICGCVVSGLKALWAWLMTGRDDSAAWAIAFTINTWAATIKSARKSIYRNVHELFDACKKGIKDAQWLDEANSLTDEDGHREFRTRLDALQEYIKRKDAEFKKDTEDTGVFMKRIMFCAAFVSVLVIVFQWCSNIALVVLLPYPLFWLWQVIRGRWAKIRVWRMRRRVKSELDNIRKRCKKPYEPPPMDELKTKLDM